MSFPGPDYVTSFVKERIQKKKSDEVTLLDNADVESQGDFKYQRQHSEGFELPRHEENGATSGKNQVHTPTTSRTPLQQILSKNQTYGTAGSVELSHSKNKARYKISEVTNENENLNNRNDTQSSSDGESQAESEHCHEDSEARDQRDDRKRKKALKKLIIATVLCFLFMCGEIIGGYLANSLAVMTDASHLLTDVSSFLVSIIALQMAAKPSSKSMTFGWHRAEVIGAIASVLTIWVVTGVLVYLAVLRIIKDEYELNGRAMLVTASCAVAFNVLMGWVLHEGGCGHSHHGHNHQGHNHGHNHDHSHHSNDENPDESGNVNVRAAFIHVIGDLLQSLGVLIAAFVIYFKPDYKIADPICTFLFSIFVLATTITILRDTIVILMEGTPASINYEKVKERLLEIPGVISVHDLRIWSLTLNQCVMSCHLAVDKSVKGGVILRRASKVMNAAYNFHSLTIQVEAYSSVMDDCKKCKLAC